jgi:hypothetical protein
LDIKNKSELVIKSNTLIEATYKLTQLQQKVLIIAISKINNIDFSSIQVSVKEVISLLHLKGQSKYHDLKYVLRDLRKREIIISETNNPKNFLILGWVSSIEVKDGIIELNFDPKLKPLLFQLKSHFTSYRLENILQLKSDYSIRIYELLKQFEKLKTRTFSLDTLKQKIGIDSEYARFYDFKKRVLLVAQKELAKKTDICFTFQEKKENKKITKIIFNIFPNILAVSDCSEKQTASSLDLNEIDDLHEKVKFMIGEMNRSQFENLLKKNGMDIINHYLDNWSKFRYKKIENKVGFFIDCVNSRYSLPEQQIEVKNKPIQATNYKQREYDDDYYESLYDNL